MASVGGMYAGETNGARPARQPDCTQLIRDAQQGDSAAFEELVHYHDRAVLRLALRLTGSEQDARDIYQETFLRAYQHLPEFRFQSSFYSWLYRIVVNLCYDYLRKRQNLPFHTSVTTSEDGAERDVMEGLPNPRADSDPQRNLLSAEVRTRLAGAMHRLSPRQRIVFELKHNQGMKLQYVAAVLNTTEATAKNELFRATHKLRAALQDLR